MKNDISLAFEIVCKYNEKSDVAEWIYPYYSQCFSTNPDLESNLMEILCSSCEYGNTEIIKWIYSLGIISDNNIREGKENLFELCCRSGNPDVVELLFSFCGDIDVYTNKDDVFHNVCIGGDLEMAQFLYLRANSSNEFVQSNSKNNFDIHHDDNYLFDTICENKDLKMLRWLFSICESDYNF